MNGVKKAAKSAVSWANKHIVQPVKKAANTAKNWINNHVVQPVKSFLSNAKKTATDAYEKGKKFVQQKYNQAKQAYNDTKNWVSNKAQQLYNDYVPPKVRKAIEEAKKFVCTTTDRIVKNTKEFIQNVDWKKVAIGIAATAAITLAVVATGGAAAPVLIGAAIGAGASTGTSIVSGAIQGKSPAEIAKDASGAFMWGAIGGAVGGGTTEALKSAGSKITSELGKKLIQDGADMAVDLTQTASENGKITGKDLLFSAASSFGGDLVGGLNTKSATSNLVDGVSDSSAVKNAADIDVPKVHGNSKNSTKVQHGYEIYDDVGNAVKTGISGQPLNKNGTSPRANSQVNKWNKEAGYEKYSADVVETNIPNRSAALEWERNNTNRLAEEGNDLNKHVYPKPDINK